MLNPPGPRLMLIHFVEGSNLAMLNAYLRLTRLNRPIGIFDAAEVWVKPWMPAGYAFVYDAGASEKPLKMRQEPIPSLQGLRTISPQAAGLDAHPLYAEICEARFGFGVYNRTAGAVHEFGVDTTYTDPSFV